MTYSWGESAGAISVGLQMVTNGGNTEGLFRAGFMQSGSPIPVGDITKGQPYYDSLVQLTGCSGAADTLNCLRGVPYATLQSAINQQPGTSDYTVGFGSSHKLRTTSLMENRHSTLRSVPEPTESSSKIYLRASSGKEA